LVSQSAIKQTDNNNMRPQKTPKKQQTKKHKKHKKISPGGGHEADHGNCDLHERIHERAQTVFVGLLRHRLGHDAAPNLK
jgi:hypothetical protein